MRIFLSAFVLSACLFSHSFAGVGTNSDNPIRIGFRSGVNWTAVSKFDLIRNITPDFKPMPALQSGVFVELPLTDNFSIQPELAFAQKGFMIKESIQTSDFALSIPLGVRASFRVNYVEVPVLAKIKFGDAETVQAYAVLGPSLGYAAGAFAKANLLGLIPLSNIPVNLDAFSYKRTEVSGIGGAGLSANLGKAQVFAEARYQQGLSRLFDTPILRLPVRNQGFSLSVGMSVGL